MCDGSECATDSNCVSGTCLDTKLCAASPSDDDGSSSSSLLWLWIVLAIIGAGLLIWLIYFLIMKAKSRDSRSHLEQSHDEVSHDRQGRPHNANPNDTTLNEESD